MTIASTLPVALTTSVIGPRVPFSVCQAGGAEAAQPTGEESARQSGRRSRTLCDGSFIAVLLPVPGANVKAGEGPPSLERTRWARRHRDGDAEPAGRRLVGGGQSDLRVHTVGDGLHDGEAQARSQ